MNNKPYYHFNFGLDFRTDEFFNIHDKPNAGYNSDTMYYYKRNSAIFDIKPKSVEQPMIVTPFHALLPSLLMTILE